MLYIPFKFVSDVALDEASKIAKFPGNKINPKDYAKNIYQPTLVMHGDIDDRINIKYGKEIFSNISSTNKKFYEIKNANHGNIDQAGGIKFREEILSFYNKYLPSK
jgi:pimeloyl-ACP methyl ester carboxylesterase